MSVASDGSEANSYSMQPSISANGRYVAFTSAASNLVPGDTNGLYDVFVHDQRRGTTTRVSLTSTGEQADGSDPAISGDGRYVAFLSNSTKLAAGDGTYGRLYVHDRRTGRTTLVSARRETVGAGPAISRDGNVVAYVLNGGHIVVVDRTSGRRQFADVGWAGRLAGKSVAPSLSAKGRFIAFRSWSDDVVRSDRNGGADIFVRDLAREKTIRVSIRPNGRAIRHCPPAIPDPEGEEPAYLPPCVGTPSLSATGRYVAFDSGEARFDRFGRGVFVRDVRRGTTKRVSVRPDGQATNGQLYAISGDGRFVAFEAFASPRYAGPLYVRGPLH